MRICLFTENYYKGGVDTFLINLVNAWPVKEDVFELVCNDTHPGLETVRKKTSRQLSISTYRYLFTGFASPESTAYRSKILRLFFRVLYRVIEYPILLPWYCYTLYRLFRKSDFDRLMVVNGGYPASLLCRSAAIAWKLAGQGPAFFNFHNLATPANWYARGIENWIDRQVLKAAPHFVTVSDNCLQSLRVRAAFQNLSKHYFIYNGINDMSTQVTGAKTVPEEPYCLMLASYEERKGHAYLLTAFKQVIKQRPDVRLRIFGYGLPEERIRVSELVSLEGLNDYVELHDFTDDTALLISGAALLVVPSQSYESFGLTIVEAMSLGIPVVTTDVGGMPEILAGRDCGFVCSRTNPTAFAKAMVSILNDPALAERLGNNGKIAFQGTFAASVMARRYQSLLACGSPDDTINGSVK